MKPTLGYTYGTSENVTRDGSGFSNNGVRKINPGKFIAIYNTTSFGEKTLPVKPLSVKPFLVTPQPLYVLYTVLILLYYMHTWLFQIETE